MPSLTIADPPTDLIKRTRSRCPVCLAEIDAEVRREGRAVVMHKTCPHHGPFAAVLSRDGERYYESLGRREGGACCGGGCGCGPGAVEGPAAAETVAATPHASSMEKLSTCIALIEIVDSCNLRCPTCYAASPHNDDVGLQYTPYEEVIARVSGVLARKGMIDILQLSGGEPTLHPRFFDLLEWAVLEPRIGYVLVNTNGLRIAADARLREQMGRLRRDRLGFELYVQFDGLQEAGQRELRGADLRDARVRAVDLAGEAGIPSTLAMTVTPQTINGIGDTVRFGLQRRHVRGVTFQPMFGSGRVRGEPHARTAPARIESTTLPVLRVTNAGGPSQHPCRRDGSLSVGDVVREVVRQSEGVIREADFTPLPCGDPNCHTIGYLLRTPSGTVGLGSLINLADVQGFLRNRVDYRLEDLEQCGCDSEPLGAIIKQAEISPDAPFRLFIKPFMDAWTFDQDRIDRCCTHVIKPDGSLDSFCRHYLTVG